MKRLDLIGRKFGRLTVMKRHEGESTKNSSWLCLCNCGQKRVVTRPNLINNHSKSCGCLSRELTKTRSITHGKTYSVAYRRWSDMKTRCKNPDTKGYKNYGGRGISICKEWNKFENFYKDMGDPPKGMTLERINNNKGYSKENCTWATVQEQANNKRNNVFFACQGKSLTLPQWARECGILHQALFARIKRGWPLREALSIKKGGRYVSPRM